MATLPTERTPALNLQPGDRAILVRWNDRYPAWPVTITERSTEIRCEHRVAYRIHPLPPGYPDRRYWYDPDQEPWFSAGWFEPA